MRYLNVYYLWRLKSLHSIRIWFVRSITAFQPRPSPAFAVRPCGGGRRRGFVGTPARRPERAPVRTASRGRMSLAASGARYAGRLPRYFSRSHHPRAHAVGPFAHMLELLLPLRAGDIRSSLGQAGEIGEHADDLFE